MPDGTSLSQVKISQLPVGGAANLTDQLEANQAGTSRSITVGQVATTVAGTLPAPPTSLPPSGAAGGDLTGSYPAPTITANVALAGAPTTTTATTADNTTKIATTAFVKAQNYALSSSIPTTLPPSGAAAGDLAGTYPAPTVKSSVVLTGSPAAPTATAGTNTTQLATTAFVTTAVAAAVGGATPTGPAGGDLSGTYPNPTLKPSLTNGQVMTTVAGVSTWAAPATSGTVTTTSVVSANGLAGTVATPTTTPAITLSTTVTGLLKGNGTAISAAVAGTDYVTPAGLPTALPPNGAASGDLTGTYPGPTIKASVGLTGTPTAPTAAAATNTTQIATTQFVTTALAALVPRVTVYTSGATWTPNANMVYAQIECWGAGGAGGGTASASATIGTGGSGGGAGSYSRITVLKATAGASQTVTIGTAGAHGAAGNNPGGNGGDTSVGTLCVGKGGAGGGGMAAAGSTVLGGLGGIAGTGDLVSTGQPGGTSVGASNLIIPSNYGGSSAVGGGGRSIGAQGAGEAATGHAAGGSGGVSYNAGAAQFGGNGTAGYVVITEFCTQ